jgi:hypothetical protein
MNDPFENFLAFYFPSNFQCDMASAPVIQWLNQRVICQQDAKITSDRKKETNSDPHGKWNGQTTRESLMLHIVFLILQI